MTGTVRDDQGNCACEVVFIEDFEILRPASGAWRMLGKAGIALFLLTIVAWFRLPLRAN